MEELPAELDYLPDHFVGSFEDRNPLACRHRENGIRAHVDVFDQVTIDDERCVVESCKPYHCFNPLFQVFPVRVASIEWHPADEYPEGDQYALHDVQIPSSRR